MVLIIYQCLWLIIHAFSRINDFVWGVAPLLEFYLHKFFTSSIRITDSDHDRKLIELSKTHLTKLPDHIVIILDAESPALAALSKIVSWAALVGIRCISFYDYKGSRLVNNNAIIQHLNDLNVTNGKINWTANKGNTGSGYICYKNGLRHKISINFLDPQQNKLHLSKICQQICASNMQSNDISTDYVDKLFSESLEVGMDPDLALYFGETCCTYGLSPWQIRLTEFVNIKVKPNSDVNCFLKGLYAYSKCEQRFGK